MHQPYHEGPLVLWRGTSSALAIAVPTVGIYLPCYDLALEETRGAMLASPAMRDYVGLAPLLAGAASRTLAVLCVAPLDLVGLPLFFHSLYKLFCSQNTS